MMLLLRTLKVVVKAFMSPKLKPLETSRISLRVWPNDIDLNLHMNNGRYLSIMDLGRVDMMVRNGILSVMLKRRWRPMVGAATIRYRRGLRPFTRYDLTTRIVCWDHKWFFMEQTFEQGGEVCAVAVIKGLFVGPRVKVGTRELAESVGFSGDSPPMPETIRNWQDWEHPRQAC
jgi:acyl-CoA thioesterase FadM